MFSYGIWHFCRRYIHNQAHAIWFGCIKIWHFYLTLSRVTVFLWTQCIYTQWDLWNEFSLTARDSTLACTHCASKAYLLNAVRELLFGILAEMNVSLLNQRRSDTAPTSATTSILMLRSSAARLIHFLHLNLYESPTVWHRTKLLCHQCINYENWLEVMLDYCL